MLVYKLTKVQFDEYRYIFQVLVYSNKVIKTPSESRRRKLPIVTFMIAD